MKRNDGVGFRLRTKRANSVTVEAGGLRLKAVQISSMEKAAMRDSAKTAKGKGAERVALNAEQSAEAYMAELFCKTFVSWEAVDGSPVIDIDSGEVVECNRENKLAAYEFDRELCWLCLAAADVAFHKREVEASKNSPAGAIGISNPEE